MKVCVFTLGCKVNRYESDVIINKLIERGYEVTENLEKADYYVINTCAVTAEAEKKSRQCVARVKKQNPDAKILICGCASENNAKQFEKDGVVYVSGTAKKDLLSLLPESGVNVEDIPKSYEESGFAENVRTRAYVKIQDGCNNFCSYCLIPYVRGRSRSRALDKVVEEVKNAMEGMLAPVSREVFLGTADVRETFSVPKVGQVAGSHVSDGKLVRGAHIRLLRNGVVVHTGRISSLRRFKDDVREVAKGYECGIGLDNYNDVKVGDVIEAFVIEEVKRT